MKNDWVAYALCLLTLTALVFTTVGGYLGWLPWE